MSLTGDPGAAVAVIQDGKIVFRQGFGVTRLGQETPVTPETAFRIGSTTKALTTFLMAKVVDRQLLTWETPVQSLLHEFELADSKLTQTLQLQHTVCNCIGMPSRFMEFLFQPESVTPEQSSHAVVWTDRDGTRSLMLCDAPYAGLIQFLVTGTTARPSLQLEVGQVRYRFDRE